MFCFALKTENVTRCEEREVRFAIFEMKKQKKDQVSK